MKELLDHLKYESRVICRCHGALSSYALLVSSTTELSLHRSLVVSKSHYIIIHCNKIFRTALQVQMFLQPLSNMLHLVKKSITETVELEMNTQAMKCSTFDYHLWYSLPIKE
jgi:hypothetical protein